MTYTNELMLLIAKYIYGEYSAKYFCEAFEARYRYVYEDFAAENQALCEELDDIAYDCAFLDIYGTNEKGLIKEPEFREKVSEVYQRAVPLAAARKVS